MRRRSPVAVYRVIDEEELLGGDHGARDDEQRGPTTAIVEPDGPHAVGAALRLRWPALRSGWASTALMIAALACAAALLLDLSSRRATPVPAAARVHASSAPRPTSRAAVVRPTLHPRQLASAVPPLRASVWAPRRPTGPLRKAAARTAEPRLPAAGGGRRAALGSPPAVAPLPSASATASAGPQQEFGFER